MTNQYEESARLIKANAIVEALMHVRAQPEHVRNANTNARLRAARLAGVNPPSTQTWDVVVEMFEREYGREHTKRIKRAINKLARVTADHRLTLEYFTAVQSYDAQCITELVPVIEDIIDAIDNLNSLTEN